jgi:hypothetical protein
MIPNCGQIELDQESRDLIVVRGVVVVILSSIIWRREFVVPATFYGSKSREMSYENLRCCGTSDVPVSQSQDEICRIFRSVNRQCYLTLTFLAELVLDGDDLLRDLDSERLSL